VGSSERCGTNYTPPLIRVGDRDFDMQAANGISKEINQATMLNANSIHQKATAEGQESTEWLREARESSGENTHVGKYSNNRYLQRIATKSQPK